MGAIRLDRFQNHNFDRGASRWKEGLWRLVSPLFFTHSFPLPSSLRASILRIFGAEIGCAPVIRSQVKIHFPWKLKVGNHVWIGEGVQLLNLAPIQLGNHVCVSQNAVLCTGSHDFYSDSFDLMVSPIHVEDHCWIAANAFIAPGVHVGRQSWVRAACRLTQNLPQKHIADGNPALIRPIKGNIDD